MNGQEAQKLILLNGKRAILNFANNTFRGQSIIRPNIGSSNGVLHITQSPASFIPNIYEYIQTRTDATMLNKFLKKYEVEEFDEYSSSAGPTVNGTATDVNNDVIHARCTIIHEYKQAGGGGPIIRLVSSDSIPVPASDYGANVIWGNLPNDELTINIEANNCTRVYIVWDSDIGVGSFNLAGASDGSGHYYIENDNYIVPSSSQITFSLTTDVSRQIYDPENDYSGYLHLTGYDANDNSVSIEIYFAP
jgi:hypothetical protein